jgi:uncharacterized repeat protein (TIGR04138 family)
MSASERNPNAPRPRRAASPPSIKPDETRACVSPKEWSVPTTPTPDWKQIREKAGPYPTQAYQFVREGLAHTVKMVHGEGPGSVLEGETIHQTQAEEVQEILDHLDAADGGQIQSDDDKSADSIGSAGGKRHITGQQLCLGLRDYALLQYGRLARTVLSSWGVRRTEDFGRIVFAMVEAGWMRKQDDDTIEDFENVFDFDEAFGTLRPARSN